MPIFHFTKEDKARAAMGDADPLLSRRMSVRFDETSDCEGVACGARPELMLPPEEYDRYVSTHGERPALGPHYHIVLLGQEPPAITCYAV
jgi:hypothetical protein